MKKKRVIDLDIIIKTYNIVLVMSLLVEILSLVSFINDKVTISFIVIDILALLFTIISIILIRKRNKYTPIIGLIGGLLLFFTRNVLGIMLGILLIYNSIRLEKYLK